MRTRTLRLAPEVRALRDAQPRTPVPRPSAAVQAARKACLRVRPCLLRTLRLHASAYRPGFARATSATFGLPSRATRVSSRACALRQLRNVSLTAVQPNSRHGLFSPPGPTARSMFTRPHAEMRASSHPNATARTAPQCDSHQFTRCLRGLAARPRIGHVLAGAAAVGGSQPCLYTEEVQLSLQLRCESSRPSDCRAPIERLHKRHAPIPHPRSHTSYSRGLLTRTAPNNAAPTRLRRRDPSSGPVDASPESAIAKRMYGRLPRNALPSYDDVSGQFG